MDVGIKSYLNAVGQTLQNPEAAARSIMQQRFSRTVLLQATLVVVIINAVLLALLWTIAPPPAEMPLANISPLQFTALNCIGMVVLASALARAGQLFGGTGNFDQALMLLIWLQAVGLMLDVAQIVLLLVSPLVAALFSLAAIFVLLRCFVIFIKVLHKFDGLGRALLTVVIALIGTMFIAGILLAILGFGPAGDAI